MEPTTGFGRGGGSLRSRSPPRIEDNSKSGGSPLRVQNTVSPPKYEPSASSQPLRGPDDQRYEERRGEELRRQIREREAELAKITSSKDRLKMRI